MRGIFPILTGTPTEFAPPPAGIRLTYTAASRTAEGGIIAAGHIYTFFVIPVPLSAPAQNSLAYTAGTQINDLTLPAASDGNGTYRYTLTGGKLPAGLTYAAATRILAGTPQPARSTRPMASR